VHIDTYVIEAGERGWHLELNGEPLAVFDERALAERAATAASRMSTTRGRVVEIVFCDADCARGAGEVEIDTVDPDPRCEGPI
jgi:hypothetical protein